MITTIFIYFHIYFVLYSVVIRGWEDLVDKIKYCRCPIYVWTVFSSLLLQYCTIIVLSIVVEYCANGVFPYHHGSLNGKITKIRLNFIIS